MVNDGGALLLLDDVADGLVHSGALGRGWSPASCAHLLKHSLVAGLALLLVLGLALGVELSLVLRLVFSSAFLLVFSLDFKK